MEWQSRLDCNADHYYLAGKLLNETHVSVRNDSNWAGVVVIDAAGDECSDDAGATSGGGEWGEEEEAALIREGGVHAREEVVTRVV